MAILMLRTPLIEHYHLYVTHMALLLIQTLFDWIEPTSGQLTTEGGVSVVGGYRRDTVRRIQG